MNSSTNTLKISSTDYEYFQKLNLFVTIAIGDRIMFLGMQDFDFCPSVFKFYPIYLNFSNFQINLNFT